MKTQVSARHPFEIFILVSTLVTSVPLLLGHVRPGSTAELLSPTLRVVWAAMLTAGAILCLAGAAWRNRLTGLLVEQIGLIAVGVATLVYVAAVYLTAGHSALLAIAIMGGYGTACGWRWWQIERYLRQVKAAVDSDHARAARRRRRRDS